MMRAPVFPHQRGATSRDVAGQARPRGPVAAPLPRHDPAARGSRKYLRVSDREGDSFRLVWLRGRSPQYVLLHLLKIAASPRFGPCHFIAPSHKSPIKGMGGCAGGNIPGWAKRFTLAGDDRSALSAHAGSLVAGRSALDLMMRRASCDHGRQNSNNGGLLSWLFSS